MGRLSWLSSCDLSLDKAFSRISSKKDEGDQGEDKADFYPLGEVRQDGERLVREGLTSREELLRVTRD